MYCKNCGEEIKDSDKTCNKCGANFKKSDASKKGQAIAFMNECKNILIKFFTKDPSGVIEEASKSRSYIGFALIAINTILFAFVACFCIPQSRAYLYNSAITSLKQIATMLKSTAAGYYWPGADASPAFHLFIPMFFLALILLAVEFAGMYIALKAKRKKIDHYLNVVNIMGVATLPLSAALILGFILGFIYPPAVPFVFVTSTFIHMILIYDGLRHIANDGKTHFTCFVIVVAILCIIMIIIFAIAFNMISNMRQQDFLKAITNTTSRGLNGLFGSIFS